MNVERNLVVVMLAYRQEEFVKEAIESMFAQTIFPSKLIILDDASPDSTQSVIREVCQNPPQGLDVELRLNEVNAGLPAQLSSIRGEFQDKLVVFQACDDRSVPHRLETLYQAWLANDKPSIIHSGYFEINELGERVGEQRGISRKPRTLENIIDRKIGLMGCAVAMSSELINTFAPICDHASNDDRVLILRGALVGRPLLIEAPLLEYRLNVGMSYTDRTTEANILESEIIYLQKELNDLSVNRMDAESVKSHKVLTLIHQREQYVKYVLNDILLHDDKPYRPWQHLLKMSQNVPFKYWSSVLRKQKKVTQLRQALLVSE